MCDGESGYRLLIYPLYHKKLVKLKLPGIIILINIVISRRFHDDENIFPSTALGRP